MIILLFVVLFLLIANPFPIKRKIEIHSSKLTQDYKVIHLSDLHSEISDKVIEWMDEEDADLILISGDLIDRKRPLSNGIETINKLKKYENIYFTSGNHEYRHREIDYEGIKQLLVENGIVVIDNQIKQLAGMNIIGISDCLQYDGIENWDKEKRLIDELMKGLNQSEFNLAIIHKPDHYLQFSDYPIDLMLSGHAHGGQWRIPGLINGIFAPQQGFFPKRAGGVYDLPAGKHIVSRGLARYWWLPRLFNRPEIIVIDLKKE